MTLCVALATPRIVIHASDRRVTWEREGRIVDTDDDRNKAVVFHLGSVSGLISFCGIATLEDLNTDRWIVKTLTSLAADPANGPELWRHFSEKLSKAYTSSTLNAGPRRHVGLEIMVTGFSSGLVINIIFRANSDGGFSTFNNTAGDLPVKTGFQRYFLVHAMGSGSMLFNELYAKNLEFRGNRGQFRPCNMEKLRSLLATMIQKVSSDAKSCGRVGGNVVVPVLLYPDQIIMKYFPIDIENPHLYMPIMVNGTMFVEASLTKVG